MTLIEKPVAGQPMRAGWGASVAERLNQIGAVGAPRQLVREGMFGQGVAPLPKNQRDRRGTPAAPQPYEVRWAQSLNEGDGGCIIWLPSGQELIVGGTVVDLTAALSAAGDPYPSGWYELANLDLSQGGDIWLNVTIPEVGEPSAEFEDQPGDGSSAAAEDNVVPILVATIEVDSTTGAKRVRQNLVGALALTRKGDDPDGISIERIPPPEEGEEPTGDEGKIQIFDFDNDESDSPEGLVERLKADTETGDIKLKRGSNIMLLARRDGKIVYIPLTADGTDPEDEEPYDPENDPCAHPGDNAPGGATSESIDGGGAGGVDDGAGGVPAGGEPHMGDDDCNCEKI